VANITFVMWGLGGAGGELVKDNSFKHYFINYHKPNLRLDSNGHIKYNSR